MDSSKYLPPAKTSLSDADLAARVNQATSTHSGIEAVMELLVAQEALRAKEEAELAAWVSQMESDGSIESINALRTFRGETLVQAEEEPIEQVEIPAQIEQEPIEPTTDSKPFSWFTKTSDDVEVEVKPEPVLESESVVEVEPVVEVAAASEFVADAESRIEDSVEVVEVKELGPEGSETLDEFDQLLQHASAEEELTALEDSVQVPVSPAPTSLVSNVVVPTDVLRNRKPFSQFLIWLGLSSTLAPVLIVWGLIELGLSAEAIIADLVIGYLVAGTLIATAALAGKRSGLSTATVARAVFGVWGNAIPLSFVYLARIAIAAVILGIFTLIMNGVEVKLPNFTEPIFAFSGVEVNTGFVVQTAIIVFVIGLSFVRGMLSRMVQIALSLLAFALVAEGFIGVVDEPLAFVSKGSFGISSQESLAGVSLVILCVLTLWVAVAPNLAKSIPMKHRGFRVFSSVLAANALLPMGIGLVSLLWLGSASTLVADGNSFVVAAVMDLPAWSRGALFSGFAIALVYAVLLSFKTAVLDFVSLFHLRNQSLATSVTGLLLVSTAFLFTNQPDSQWLEYLVNIFLVVAALSAGWIGMFVSDVALRRVAYHELSLSRAYGFYKKFNIISLVIWLVTLSAAIALMPVNLLGFGFMGFLAPTLGLGLNLGTAAIGFVITVTLGALLTVTARVSQIRKQEREVEAVESRREQLNDIFVGQE